MTTVVGPASVEVGVKSISVGLVLMYTPLASVGPTRIVDLHLQVRPTGDTTGFVIANVTC